MKSLISVAQLDSLKLEKFISNLKSEKININSKIYYKGQVVFAALYIKAGSVLLKRKNKVKAEINANSIILYSELLNKTPINFDIEISGGSEIIWLSQEYVKKFLTMKKHMSELVY